MEILIKPIITEKMTAIGDKLQQYGFVVNDEANKVEISKAVESLYGVQVSKVRTMKIPARERTRFTRSGVSKGRKSGFKKAIVTLQGEDIIDFFREV